MKNQISGNQAQEKLKKLRKQVNKISSSCMIIPLAHKQRMADMIQETIDYLEQVKV